MVLPRCCWRCTLLRSNGPHAFRYRLPRDAAKTCTSVAEMVATPQNLGHIGVLTTLRSYGQIGRDRMRVLIRGVSGDNLLEEKAAGGNTEREGKSRNALCQDGKCH